MATPPVTDTMLVGHIYYYLNKEHLANIVLDFVTGWEPGVLQKAVDNCHCNPFGDVSFISIFLRFSL